MKKAEIKSNNKYLDGKIIPCEEPSVENTNQLENEEGDEKSVKETEIEVQLDMSVDMKEEAVDMEEIDQGQLSRAKKSVSSLRRMENVREAMSKDAGKKDDIVLKFNEKLKIFGEYHF